MLKGIGAGVLAAVRFVVEVLAETIIELRWILLIGLSLMGLLWLWMQNDPHRPSPGRYHAGSLSGWTTR